MIEIVGFVVLNYIFCFLLIHDTPFSTIYVNILDDYILESLVLELWKALLGHVGNLAKEGKV